MERVVVGHPQEAWEQTPRRARNGAAMLDTQEGQGGPKGVPPWPMNSHPESRRTQLSEPTDMTQNTQQERKGGVCTCTPLYTHFSHGKLIYQN